MDAQNAAGSDKTKPVASPKRPGTEPDETKLTKSTHGIIKRPKSPIRGDKSTVNSTRQADDEAGGEATSDAETIVLPGKDGHSPSKARKVKHEDKSDGEGSGNRRQRDHGPPQDADRGKNAGASGSIDNISSQANKKKRSHDKQPRSKDGSSGLSSAPASPPHQSRRPGDARSDSDSDPRRKTSPKMSTKDRAKSTDRVIPHKRKAVKAESEDEAESRKARRQRVSDTGVEASRSNRPSKEQKSVAAKSHNDGQSGPRRSTSPHPRLHRRSISTQLPPQSSNGLSHKKKRVPAPLQSTDYHSDESSASGSPHPRSSKLRNLSTPATADSNISPAKMAPHKKHLDAHGQTFLARACARGEYDVAKTRLAERPEDLNVADYAGNTPLQIASINGYEDIVKLLIDAGCNLDCVNYDKDTPLLDAVDNGHLEVVKLLLAAGVNPRKANVSGEEPLDRVSDDLENAAEFRAALIQAKQRQGDTLQRASEEHVPEFHDARSSHGPESPRESPAAIALGHAGGRRSATVRATKTSNHLLYMPLDDKTLRQAAGKGDEETVTRILQVKDGCDDAEAMVAAARGGHEVVIQLLLALGGANPDPPPVPSMAPEFATPMLAAIGQENIKVIRLLLDQGNFDPTRRFKGETYHEIARRRQGTNWKEEEHMLKEAYDRYKKSHRDLSKTKSPNRQREREQDREAKRLGRNDTKGTDPKAHKRNLSSPTRDSEPRKKLSSGKATTSPKEKRRANSFTGQQDDQTSPKRGPGRPRKEERLPTIAVSDRESSPLTSQKQLAKTKRAESDLANLSSEGENLKPRRKLISKGELRGEREKQRRTSMVSNASSMKEPSSPRDSRQDEQPERSKGEPLTEKYHDRTKALKRDESKDRLSVSSDTSSKRHRSSVTPPHSSTGDKDDSEAPSKRRRLDVESKERRAKSTGSPDGRLKVSRDNSTKSKPSHRDGDAGDDRRSSTKSKTEADPHRRESGRSSTSDKSSIHVKSEDVDIEMPDASEVKETGESDPAANKDCDEEERKRRDAEAEAARRKEEQQQKRAAEERRKREEEEELATRRQEEEEKKRKAEEERKRQEEETRLRLEEEERIRREAEEKRLREEMERKRLAEEEEKRRKEEEERRQREEAERLRKEQLEREAAEEARRIREEEERREKERTERLLREEMERKRAAREAEQQRIFQEQERQRLAKLPPLLRWLDSCPNPKVSAFASLFKHMQGVRYDTIRPQATGTPEGREQWVLNTQVALLFGEKDLSLSRYTAWEHIPVSSLAKRVIWRLEADRYALTSENLYDLGLQLSDYYGDGEDPHKMSYRVTEKLRREAWDKFSKLDMFFVKLSDLLYIVPNIAHLRDLKLGVEYRELPENEDGLVGWKGPSKWKQDPDADRFYGFAPRNKYYVNGLMIREQRPGLSATSRTPFPERRVPRKGLQQVYPGDPDYSRLCKEQGLHHLLNGLNSPAPDLPNGLPLSPASQSNGNESVVQASTEPIEGIQPENPATASTPSGPQPLVNGVNGTPSMGPN